MAAAGGESGELLYRGVHAGHPELAAARRGEAIPADLAGTVMPAEHNIGGASARSQFTSWTHSLVVARMYATARGPGGVILSIPVGAPPVGAAWSWEWSPDVFGEQEVLLRGIRTGAMVLRP